MPKYRVKPGRPFGVARTLPGDTVTMTETEAAGFLDRLERVDDDESPAVETPPAETIPAEAMAPGGGFEPSEATVAEIRQWLDEEQPGRNQAAVVLQLERDGSGRVTAIEALENYIAEAD